MSFGLPRDGKGRAPDSARGRSGKFYARAGRMVVETSPRGTLPTSAVAAGEDAARSSLEPSPRGLQPLPSTARAERLDLTPSPRARQPASSSSSYGQAPVSFVPRPSPQSSFVWPALSKLAGDKPRAGVGSAAKNRRTLEEKLLPPGDDTMQRFFTKRTDDSDSDDEEHFRSMRQKAKMKTLDKCETAHKRIKTELLRSNSNAGELSQGNIHSSCFNYEGNAEAWMSLCPGTEIQQRTNSDPADDVAADFVFFFQAHGLSGPLRTYAQAMILQGIQDPAALIVSNSAKLKHVIRMAQLDSSDELLLLSGLRDYH